MNTTNALRVAATASDTTLQLASPSDFQNNGVVLIGSELISYTHASDTALIGCTRAWGGTTAATHAVGASVAIQADASLLLTLAASTVPTLQSVTTTERGYVTVNGTATVTVSDFGNIAGSATVTVNGTAKTAGGTDWTAATSNSATATSLATALNAITGISASATNAVVTITASNPGIANNFTLASSDAVRLTCSSTTLLGGLPATGMMIFNSTTNKINVFNGTAWVDLVPVTTDATPSPITIVSADPSTPTEGQIWYNSTSHVLKYKDNVGTKTVTAA